MRAWEVQDAWGVDNMKLVERSDPAKPAADEVVIRLHAGAINYRDHVVVTNKTPFGALPQIPLSDASGEVIAIGAAVDRFKIGDRVCPMFFPRWIDGPPNADNRAAALGSASTPGVLQDVFVARADAVSAVDGSLNWREAATLPCAGLTAWRALMAEGDLRAGDTVLVQGTGGVSIFALQFAKMAGASVIVTSSSDEKLARAKALGADHVINYRETPEWGKRAVEITGGVGVSHVVEVGGAGTINQSLVAASVGGAVLIIGVLGGRSQELLMPAIFGKNLRLLGISVGSCLHFEDMNAAIAKAGMKPIIDKVYPFGRAPDALASLAEAQHFGKIVIDYDQ